MQHGHDSPQKPRLACELIACGDGDHVQQIYTGFALLHRRGVLTLRQTIPGDCLLNKTDPGRWVDYRFSNVTVTVNGRSVCYDMHDRNWIDQEKLASVDFYFKRSFDPPYVSRLPQGRKVFPLGLNYPVTSAGYDPFRLQRSAFYAGPARLKTAIKALQFDRWLPRRSDPERMNNLEAAPHFLAEPRVLFMARAWNPDRIQDSTQRAAVEALNESRAESIRRLRQALGARFFGGLSHDEYSAARFRDALLPDNSLANKRRYVEVLRDYPICVTTVGLNGSNGWKLGEYVAQSKAIVTEPPRYTVPGGFGSPAHYLEFATPDELVGAAMRLMEDRELRCAMMMNNHRYYQAYLRPDSLVLNTLAIVAAGVAPARGTVYNPERLPANVNV